MKHLKETGEVRNILYKLLHRKHYNQRHRLVLNPLFSIYLERRRSSTSSGTGIRVGGGLVEPKAPNQGQFMMPFGAAAVKPANLVNLLKNPKSRSKSQSRSSSKDTKSHKSENKQKRFDIKTSTQEIQSLTSALNSSSSLSTSTKTTNMTFKEVEVRNKTKEEHNISFTVNKPIQRRARHESLSKKQSNLPDQSVTKFFCMHSYR